MNQLQVSFPQRLLSATLTSGLLVATVLNQSAEASLIPNEREPSANGSLISLEFKPPGDVAPTTSVGGGVRGNVQFAAPGDVAPTTSVGGGVRGNVQFAAPGDVAPTNSVGGGVRGDVQFAAPGDVAPTNSVGGGVRGDVQFTAPGNATPTNSVGGGVRSDVEFTAPGNAAPTNSVGGGVRSEDLPAMTALLPPSKLGLTVSARPTFFVYLPPTLSKEVFFSLQDEQGKHHYQTRLKLSGKGGIISITLPENAPELDMNKHYLWFFAPIQPNGILQPDNYVVTGWVKRVQPKVTGSRQSSSSAIEQATAYAQAGIWYDTLKVLAMAQKSQSDNATLTQEWKALLEQMELSAIATQPFAERL